MRAVSWGSTRGEHAAHLPIPRVGRDVASKRRAWFWVIALVLIPSCACADTKLEGLVVNPGNSTCDGGCWLPATYQDSARVCQCVKQDCSNDAFPDLCTICSRGFGVYATREECEAAGSPIEELEVKVESYPSYLLEESELKIFGKCPSITSGGEGCPFVDKGLKWWHLGSTWPDGRVPAEDSHVTLPQNKRVIVSGCSFQGRPYFKSITIPETSTLVFADQTTRFSVGTIKVKGKLQAGSPSCRLNARLVITFKEYSGMDKDKLGLLSVAGTGQVDIHGKEFSPTWTRLAATAKPGDKSIKLKSKVNWRPGQLVVIVTTHMKDTEVNQNEVVRIKLVSGNTVTLAKPLEFHHYGGSEYQAEVGLLSRNIALQSRNDGSTVGGHVMLRGPVSRLSGVSLLRMGQANKLGRYSVHFHMVGDTSQDKTFAKDLSCYMNHFRCVTLHGTNGALVSDTVSFGARGSAFYIEGGTERNNVFHNNLAAFIRPVRDDSVGGRFSKGWIVGCCQGGGTVTDEHFADPSDAAAAGFYAASVSNTWTKNAASGGFFGFSFPSLPSPITEELRNENVDPSKFSFVKFDGNVAHSTGWQWDQGAAIYLGGKLWYNKDDGGRLTYSNGRRMERNTDGFVRLTNSKVFLTRVGVTQWGRRIEIHGLKVIDSYRTATLLGTAWLNKAKVNARGGNPSTASGFPASNYQDHSGITGFQWYDTGTQTIITKSTFANFKRASQGWWSPAVFIPMSHSDFFTASGCMSYTRNIRYKNVDRDVVYRNRWYNTNSWRFNPWLDVDGSASMRKGPNIIGSGNSWWKVGFQCEYMEEWGSGAWVCPVKSGGPGDMKPARIDWHVPGYTNTLGEGSAMPATHIGTVSQLGYRKANAARFTDITRNTGVLGMTGLWYKRRRASGWHFSFDEGAPRKSTIYLTQVPAGTYLYVSSRYPHGASFDIWQKDKWSPCHDRQVTRTSSLYEFMSDPSGFKYYSKKTKVGTYLYLKLVDPSQSTSFARGGVEVPRNRWYDFWYQVNIANHQELDCNILDGKFCRLRGGGLLTPKSLPPQPASSCTDIPPKGFGTSPSCGWFRCSRSLCSKYPSNCQNTCGTCTANNKLSTAAVEAFNKKYGGYDPLGAEDEEFDLFPPATTSNKTALVTGSKSAKVATDGKPSK